MIDYIKGHICEISPTQVILESFGIGYNILISLHSYESLKGQKETQIFIHHHLREDDEQYFGFATKVEREIFRHLISVSGVGANTARLMLSSLSPDEMRNAILGEDINRIKSIKGIGIKTAQRIILELKDKLVKGGGEGEIFTQKAQNQEVVDEATAALLMLGYSRVNIGKAIQKVLKSDPAANVESLIKTALQIL